MKVVLIYTGLEVPSYVFQNLQNIRLKFPNISLTFVSDSDRLEARVRGMGIEFWTCISPEKSLGDIKSGLSHPMDFRGGFWFHSLSRLLVIRDFLAAHPEESVLQIECDVWLARDFPFHLFDSIKEDIAYPMLTNELGVASVLYIRNVETSIYLCDFIRESVRTDPSTSDMKILGRFARENPSAFHDLGDADHIEPFSGIFDAAKWGIYFLGEDPRNHQGRLFLYQDSDLSKFSKSGRAVSVLDSGAMLIRNELESFSLYCLHVHSKDSRIFNAKNEVGYLRNQVELSQYGPSAKRLWLLTARLGLSAIRRRLVRGCRNVLGEFN